MGSLSVDFFFQFPITKKEFGAVTDVAFSPVDPYNYAVTSSARVRNINNLYYITYNSILHLAD